MSADLIWKNKLKILVDRDQFIRDALDARGVLEDAYHPELIKVHRENAEKLKGFIEKYGFPVLSNAGEEGVHYAWLIINHALPEPDFMRNCIIQMRLAAAQADYPLDLLAYTEDLICYLEGRPQLYGTHFDWHEDVLRPTTIEDPFFLDKRRSSMGLPPMEESIFRFPLSRPPRDPVLKTKTFTEWLKLIGWRI